MKEEENNIEKEFEESAQTIADKLTKRAVELMDDDEAKKYLETLHPRCGECHFFDILSGDVGFCVRKSPPWCVVDKNKWCGEWLSLTMKRTDSTVKRLEPNE